MNKQALIDEIDRLEVELCALKYTENRFLPISIKLKRSNAVRQTLGQLLLAYKRLCKLLENPELPTIEAKRIIDERLKDLPFEIGLKEPVTWSYSVNGVKIASSEGEGKNFTIRGDIITFEEVEKEVGEDGKV